MITGYRRRVTEWRRRAEEALALSDRLRAENQELRARLFDAERLAHTNCRTCWDETYLGLGKPCPDCNDEDWS